MNKRILSTTLIIALTNNKTVFNLPNSDILRSKKLTGVSTFITTAATTAFAPDGTQVIPESTLLGGYLTLISDTNRFIDQLPLRNILITDQDKEVFPLDQYGINSTQSSVEFANTGIINNGESVVLTFFYQE